MVRFKNVQEHHKNITKLLNFIYFPIIDQLFIKISNYDLNCIDVEPIRTTPPLLPLKDNALIPND